MGSAPLEQLFNVSFDLERPQKSIFVIFFGEMCMKCEVEKP